MKSNTALVNKIIFEKVETIKTDNSIISSLTTCDRTSDTENEVIVNYKILK
jgi:hypothetical protein